MDTLSAREAALLLHVQIKQVQKMAREGRLPAVRVGRKWLFPRASLERVLSAPAANAEGSAGRPAAGAGHAFLAGLSARNRLRGTVTGLLVDGLMAEVRVQIGGQELVSVITRSSAERLGLAVGVEVYAVVKSTEVMIARPDREG